MGGPSLTSLERERILLMHNDGKSLRTIGDELNRDKKTIQAYLASVAPTAEEAKAILAAGVAPAAVTVVEKSKEDAQTALEYLDRMKVLQKVRDSVPTGLRLSVIIGMPGRPAMVPPSQERIDEIAAAQQKAIAGATVEVVDGETRDT